MASNCKSEKPEKPEPDQLFRDYHEDLCQIFDSVDVGPLAVGLYSRGIIDLNTKNKVMRKPGYVGADNLFTSVTIELKHNPDRLKAVFQVMEKQETLYNVIKKMKRDMNQSEDDADHMSLEQHETTDLRSHENKNVVSDAAMSSTQIMKNHCPSPQFSIRNLGHSIEKSLHNGSSDKLLSVASVVGPIVDKETSAEFESLFDRFVDLFLDFKEAIKVSNAPMERIQSILKLRCGLAPIQLNDSDAILDHERLMPDHCSLLNFRIINSIVEKFLIGHTVLKKRLKDLESDVENFKSSTKMVTLANLITSKYKPAANSQVSIVKLKVQEFWAEYTMKNFEIVMSRILKTLYNWMTNISVGTGCICISWTIPADAIIDDKLVPEHSLEFLHIIGVISLHIGEKLFYNIERTGCETIEAAMLQAIEVKNTQAIEILLAVGCSPEVATYNGNKTVTIIVNIKESSEPGRTIEHVCVLGQNKYTEAIVSDGLTPIESAKCELCIIKDRMVKGLQQEIFASQKNYESEKKKFREELSKGIVIQELSQEKDALQHKSEQLDQKNENLQHKNEELCQENDILHQKNKVAIAKNEELQLAIKKKNYEFIELEERLKIQDAENTLLKQELKRKALKSSTEEGKMKDERSNLSPDVNEYLNLELLRTMESRVPLLNHRFQFTSNMFNFPVDLTMNNFSERVKTKEQWYSPSFYTHLQGYKMCIRLRPSGQDEGEGTHLSIYVHLMSGKNDDRLPWPFNGEIHLSLLNQRANSNDFNTSIIFDQFTSILKSGKVVGGLRIASGIAAASGVGIEKFVSHSDLQYNPATGTAYLKDDAVFIRVIAVKINSPGQLRPTPSRTCIKEFTMKDFSQKKSADSRWESDAFYTHDGGYKFLLAVHCNGKDEHKGKSLSVYAHLMKGDNDHLLPFPFRGHIIVQLVNQTEDHGKNHVEHTIKFSEETDPEGKYGARISTFSFDHLIAGRSYTGLGYPDFIHHEYLPFDKVQNTQYLTDNDELIFKVYFEA